MFAFIPIFFSYPLEFLKNKTKISILALEGIIIIEYFGGNEKPTNMQNKKELSRTQKKFP